MSTVEIEDVLSSIRRLVSEDLRIAPAEAARKPVPRLVLTQALRVDAPPAPARRPAMGLPVAPPVEVDPQDEAEVQPELAARLAELEAILDSQDQCFDDEAEERLDLTFAVPRVAEAPFVGDVAPEPAVPEAGATMFSWAEAAEPAAPEGGVTPMFAWIDATEAAGPESGPASALSWTDAAAPLAPPEPALPEPAGLSLLDEGVLRELIRDVLREELQGEVGERVTRNLRKMIRTEIGRALTARGIV